MKDRRRYLTYYKELLQEHIDKRDEQTLYKGQRLSRHLLEQGVSPEEVLSLHIDVLEDVFPDMDEHLQASFNFLLEGMIGYGMAYREHQSLRQKQRLLESEIDIAAEVQQSLLIGNVPTYNHLDIGLISRPAKKMSGDYYHFVVDDHDNLSIAIADIVGKGIPAALCMSMIKYAMDSLPEQRMQPRTVLGNLNHVVEQNVDPSMFITMFYGLFNPKEHKFYYSSAGHEPGFFYSAKNDCFEEIKAKGHVLGLSRFTKYVDFEKSLAPGDMVILLSDGVTECRTEKGFIERKEIIELIRTKINEPAQKIVDQIYLELEKMQDFQLRDDFTLIIFKTRV